MQAKLNSLQQESEERRHVLRAKPRLAFIMAALLVIAGITAIAATSTIRYQVSWEGELKEYEPRDDDEESDAFYRGIPDEIHTKADSATEEGFYITITGPHEESCYNYPCKLANSEEDLIALLDGEGYPHPASLVPEGYTFEYGRIEYNLLDDEKKNLADSMTIGDYSLKIYSVEPENRYIDTFRIAFSNDEKENSYTWIDVTESCSKEGAIFFNTDTACSMETLSVPWMEDAFVVRTDELTRLHMIKNIKNRAASFIGINPYRSQMIYLSVHAEGAVDDVLNSDWGHWR